MFIQWILCWSGDKVEEWRFFSKNLMLTALNDNLFQEEIQNKMKKMNEIKTTEKFSLEVSE